MVYKFCLVFKGVVVKHQFKLLCLVAAGLVALSGCGGGGGGGTPPSTLVDLGGTAAKGILIGADVAAYAVVDGKQATTALATTKTDASGAYLLKVPVTSGPVIVEVKANSSTKMLDETGTLVGGKFPEVPAPAGLTMRSFSANASEVKTEVRVNPLTEMAVAVAAGATGGLSINNLLAGQQVAQLAAPAGVNPFTQEPVAEPAKMTDDQLKFAIKMAGLMSSAKTNTSCDLQCQIGNLSKDVTFTIAADGKANFTADVTKQIAQRSSALVASGTTSLKVNANQVDSVASTGAQLKAAADSLAITPVALVTAKPEEVMAANGLQGFVDAMRNGFKTTETRLIKVEEDLNKRYENVTLDGVSFVGKVLNAIEADCDTELKMCSTSATSLFNWTGSGNTFSWVTKNPDSDGRTSSGTVVGTFIDGGEKTASINGSISKNGKDLVLMKDIKVSVNDGGDANFSASVNGVIQANDSQSNLTVSLNLVNIAAISTPRAENIANVTFKGGLSLSASNGDNLTGNLDVKMVEITKKIFYGNNNQLWYEDYDEFITDGKISLTAVTTLSGSAMDILALDVKLTSSLPDYSKPVSSSNVETYSGTATFALVDKLTTVSFTESAADWKNMNQTATIQSGGSEIKLSAAYSADNTTGSWCQWNEIKRCTNQLLLTSTNANPYKATLTKGDNGKTKGDIFLGDTKVGEIVNGVLKINGVEVSLY